MHSSFCKSIATQCSNDIFYFTIELPSANDVYVERENNELCYPKQV